MNQPSESFSQKSRRRALALGAVGAVCLLGGVSIVNQSGSSIEDDTHAKIAKISHPASNGEKTTPKTDTELHHETVTSNPASVTDTLVKIQAQLKGCGWQCEEVRPRDKRVKCTLPDTAGFGPQSYLFIESDKEQQDLLLIARSRNGTPFTTVDGASTCEELTGDIAIEVQRDNHWLMATARNILSDTGFFDLTGECPEGGTCTLHAELKPLPCGDYRGWFTDSKKVGDGVEYQATMQDLTITVEPTADTVTVKFHAVKDNGNPIPHNNGWTQTLNPDKLPDFITEILDSSKHGFGLFVDRTDCPK